MIAGSLKRKNESNGMRKVYFLTERTFFWKIWAFEQRVFWRMEVFWQNMGMRTVMFSWKLGKKGIILTFLAHPNKSKKCSILQSRFEKNRLFWGEGSILYTRFDKTIQFRGEYPIIGLKSWKFIDITVVFWEKIDYRGGGGNWAFVAPVGI